MSRSKKLSSIRWSLFLPALALLLAGVGYSIWWVKLADRIEEELLAWREEQVENGIIAQWNALERGGFPYRLEIRLAQPRIELTNTHHPVSWTADTLNAQMLAYNLDHVIIDAPGAHQVSYTETRDETEQHVALDLLAETFWASLVLEDDGRERFALDLTDIRLDRTFETDGGRDAAGHAAAQRLQLHARPTSPAETNAPRPGTQSLSYDAALRAENVSWEGMGATPWTGTHITTLEAQMRLSGLPGDLLADEDQIPARAFQAGTKLAVSEFKLLWGPIDMTGYGEMVLDSKGRPEGQFRTSVGNLPSLIDALVDARVMTRQSATLAFAGLTALSNLQGEESGRVRLPVAMKEGVLFLGPVAAARLEPIL